MQEGIKLLLGIAVLILGVFIGEILAKNTPEELKDGKKWFYFILITCFIGTIWSLIFRNDILLFTFLFIAIVTSRSIKRKKKRSKKEIKRNNKKKNKKTR
jgi:uncharacterized membrane protein YfcA